MEVFFTEEFEEDLAQIALDPNLRGEEMEIYAYFEELCASHSDLLTLTKHGNVIYSPWGQVSKVINLQDQGYCIYRLKPLPPKGHLGKYRFIYAHDIEFDDFYLLAIVKKIYLNGQPDPRYKIYDYELQNPLTLRIIQQYTVLGLRTLSKY